MTSYRRDDYRHKWRIETRAAAVRKWLGLDQFQVLDPARLVRRLGADVFHLRDLVGGDEVALRRARRIAFDGAAAQHPQTGRPMILLNCGRPPRRRTATLMEELAHLILGHQPCRIGPHPQLGVVARTYDRAQEREAYDLGAALLLPKERIQRDVKERRLFVGEIADAHRCSEQLVVYRVQRLRLWNRYRTYARAAS